MGTWGSGNFDNDGALDFVNQQIDFYVGGIEGVFGDVDRFRLDEDAESSIIPSVVVVSLLCEHCHGTLPEHVDVLAWKVRHLEMFDDQVDALEPEPAYKRQRRAEISATFDNLLQWRREERVSPTS
jgi:hypothetical protein